MAGITVVSPLCTWLVAACMSVPCGKERSLILSSSSKRRSRWERRLRATVVGRDSPGGLISAFCGSGIQGLMSSFEPCCASFYSVNSRSAFFGDNGLFSLWKPASSRPTSVSGKAMAAAVQPAEEVAERKRTHTKQRRVVVTGMGVVTSLGNDPDVFYNNLLEGVSGIRDIETFDCTNFPTRIAGEVKSFSTDGWVSAKLSKRMDKFMLYLITAGKKALVNGGLTEEAMRQLDKAKCGVLIGSAMGGMKIFNDAIEALRVSYRKMNPFCIPFATTNMGSAILAMDLGWMGPNYSISTACATSNFCILNAANHIIRGEADVMLCGGSDAAIIPIGLGGFVACRALSQRNDDPTKASRPWDMAIRTGWLHPNINLDNPEEALDMNVLVGSAKESVDVKVALSNSFGFGGHNSSILFAPFKG